MSERWRFVALGVALVVCGVALVRVFSGSATPASRLEVTARPVERGHARIDVEDAMQRAQRALIAGERTRALVAYEEVVAQAPHHWRALAGAGHEFLVKGVLNEAADRLERALAEPRADGTPEDTALLSVDLACVKSREGRHAEAKVLREQALSLGADETQFKACQFATDPDEGKPPVVATIERTACYGTCPQYRLTVRADGSVTWEGQEYVKVRAATAQLTPQELAAVQKLFIDAHYLDLVGNFACDEMTDNPSVITSFDDGKRSKRIEHYHGCRSTPGIAALTTLENQFDALVHSARWVK